MFRQLQALAAIEKLWRLGLLMDETAGPCRPRTDPVDGLEFDKCRLVRP